MEQQKLPDQGYKTNPHLPERIENHSPVFHAKDEWELLQRQAKAAFVSKLLPDSVKTLEQAIVIALKGKELGLPIMEALSSISVIRGKPTLSAELMLALIYRRIPGVRVTFTTPPEKAHEECTLIFQRPHGDPQTFRFSIEDAKRAGLLMNPSWGKYPQAMLRARTVSAMARAAAPDAVLGCLTPEELGFEHTEEIEAHVMPLKAPPEKATRTFLPQWEEHIKAPWEEHKAPTKSDPPMDKGYQVDEESDVG